MNKKIILPVIVMLFFYSMVYCKIGILVNGDLYPQIRESVLMYANDVVEVEKKSVWIDSTTFNEEWILSNEIPEQALRDTLKNHYENDSLEGVVLIGTFPVVELVDLWIYQVAPTEAYFMDLDGNWEGRNAEDKYISQYDKYSGDANGKITAEIWISRIFPLRIVEAEHAPENVTEKAIVDSYLLRVHNRMRGIDKGSRKAYSASCDFSLTQWKYLRNSCKLKNQYDSIPYEYLPSSATYKQRLQEDFDVHFVLAHSKNTYQDFGWSGNSDHLNYWDFLEIAQSSKVRFFVNAACHLHDISRTNFGVCYALLGSGLAAWGHTVQNNFAKRNAKFMLDPLGEGKSYGEALKIWFNSIDSETDLNRTHLAHVVQGAGTLRLQPYPESAVSISKSVNSSVKTDFGLKYQNGILSITEAKDISDQTVKIQIFTLNGRIVKSIDSNMENGVFNLPVKGIMAQGVYLFKLSVGVNQKVQLVSITE